MNFSEGITFFSTLVFEKFWDDRFFINKKLDLWWSRRRCVDFGWAVGSRASFRPWGFRPRGESWVRRDNLGFLDGFCSLCTRVLVRPQCTERCRTRQGSVARRGGLDGGGMSGLML